MYIYKYLCDQIPFNKQTKLSVICKYSLKNKEANFDSFKLLFLATKKIIFISTQKMDFHCTR